MNAKLNRLHMCLTGKLFHGLALGLAGLWFPLEVGMDAALLSTDSNTISYDLSVLPGERYDGQYLPGFNVYQSVDFGATIDLSNASFEGADLTGATLGGATLTGANFTNAVIRGMHLSPLSKEQVYATRSYQDKNLAGVIFGFDAAGWDLRGQDLSGADFSSSGLENANFSGAIITGAYFGPSLGAGGNGLSLEQLRSTHNYQVGDLSGVQFFDMNLAGWNFSGQSLSNASFANSALGGASFAGAMIEGADFSCAANSLDSASYFAKEQLYSTKSYAAKNLHRIKLVGLDLRGWNFAGQDLTGADLGGALLMQADLTGALIQGVRFNMIRANYFGPTISKDQIYATRSYQEKNISGIQLIGFYYADFDSTDWYFNEQNLTHAVFYETSLTNADFTGSLVGGASFANEVRYGFRKEMLYATRSYQEFNLGAVDLSLNDLSGWDFDGQNLAGANFSGATVTNTSYKGAIITNATLAAPLSRDQLYATKSYQDTVLTGVHFEAMDLRNWSFSGQNLSHASFHSSQLDNASFSGALIPSVDFGDSTVTMGLVAATKSYQDKNLPGLGLDRVHLTGWNLQDQYLVNASFGSSDRNGDFTRADVRGARYFSFDTAARCGRNVIRPYNYGKPDGWMTDLTLQSGERFILRNYRDTNDVIQPSVIRVSHGISFHPASTLEVHLDGRVWSTVLRVDLATGIQLAGQLEVKCADATVRPQLGDTVKLFEAPKYAGAFASINLPTLCSGLAWDTTSLLKDGALHIIRDANTPYITASRNLSVSGFNLAVAGPSGASFRVFASSDLQLPMSQWTEVGTGTFAQGQGSFIDTNMFSHLARFYRVLTP